MCNRLPSNHNGGIKGGGARHRTETPNLDGGITVTKLSDKAVKAFMSTAVPGKKLADGAGLHLFKTPAGGCTWRVKYRLDGKEKLYSIGPYPLVSLASARVELASVKGYLLEGRDPVAQRRISRVMHAVSTDTTLESVAREWLEMKRTEWSNIHFVKSSRALERDIFPMLGKIPIATIGPAMVAKVIEQVNKRDVLETASRILQHLNGVFRYAQAKGLCRDNPAVAAREVLPRKKEAQRMAALLSWPELGAILRGAQMARLSQSVHMAHRLCAYTATRIGNVVNAEWQELNLESDSPTWVIPRIKMKVTSRQSDHRIPLCKEIATELKKWKQLSGCTGYVFPSVSGKEHVSREAIEKVYRVTLGLAGKHSPHGWRSSFSTLARDHGFQREIVELALDHVHDNEVARAYDRGERFDRKVELYAWWGNELTKAEQITRT